MPGFPCMPGPAGAGRSSCLRQGWVGVPEMTETWELPAATAAAITAEAARETMSFAHGILLRLVLLLETIPGRRSSSHAGSRPVCCCCRSCGVPPRSAGRRNRAGNSCSLAGDGTLIRRSGAPGDRGSRIGRAAAERAGGHGGAEATGQELHLLASKAEVHRRHWLSGVAAAAPWDLMEVGGNSLVGFRDNAGAGTIGVSGRNWGTGCRMSRG